MQYPAVKPRNVFALFAAISIASGLSQVVFSVIRGIPLQAGDVMGMLANATFIWMLFGALSLIAIEAARRFPIEKSNLTRALPVHAGAFVAISMTHTLLYVPFTHLVLGRAGRIGMGEEIAISLIANLRGDIFIYGAMVGAYYLHAYMAAQSSQTASATPAERDAAPAQSAHYLTRIPLKDDGRVGFIDVGDIEQIEADGDYVRVYFAGGRASRLIRQSLSSLEKELDPRQFVRVHRSAIVRLAAIQALEPMFHGEFVAIMDSGARVKVSRTYRAALTSSIGLKA
jgi:DNA-binding LytR/AlgR family response regulator